MTYESAKTDNGIQIAALKKKWDDGLFIDPKLLTKTVNERLETPLMLAVGTNRSNEFVKNLLTKTVDNLDEWCGVSESGDNVFHYAALVGNLEAAKLIGNSLQLSQISKMLSDKNSDGDTPMLLAAKRGRTDIIDFFLDVNPFTNIEKGDLVISTIQSGLLDLTLEMLNSIGPDEIPSNALEALATKPEFFPSGNKLGFWGGLIYQCMPNIGNEILEQVTAEELKEELKKLETRVKKIRSDAKTWAPAIKNIQDIKIKIEEANAIMKYLCKIEMVKNDPEVAKKVLGSAIAEAVKYGIYELIEECILARPGMIWYKFEDGYNLFHLAIKEHQVQVYNLVYQMSGHKVLAAIPLVQGMGEDKENALHIAAKLAPSHRPSTIIAPLQLQIDLQLYKEVETFVGPEYAKALNKDGKTPWMVFKDEHKSLLNESQQWMKSTATSSTVVAALIVTITFTAAITPPGGYKDDGKPVLLNERAFLLFMISDALALFSSSTSLLMFLGILTSSYAEIDFLLLPKRLAIGLVSLCLSIAATMIAFGANHVLLLCDKVTWIAAPVVMITSIPAGLYALLQFPLHFDLVRSTYGPSIFGKRQSSTIFY